MTKITLNEAIELLQKCSACITENGYFFYPCLSEINGDPENEFAFFKWEDDEALVYCVKFVEGNNQNVVIEADKITLVDNEGDDFLFSLLGPINCEKLITKTINAHS